MRIVFFVNYDIESSIALNILWLGYEKHFAGIFYTQTIGGKKNKGSRMLDQLAFVEREVVPSLMFDYLQIRSGANCYFLTFDEMARYYDGPFEKVDDINDPKMLDQLRALKPDLFVSIRFGKIFGEEAIQIPRHGVLNLHSGVLPDYRGVLPTFRALMNGDSTIGCTLHRIDSPQIDSGEILAIARRKVRPDQTLLRQVASLYPIGAELIAQAIDTLRARRKLKGQKQDPTAGAYYSFPTEAEVLEFHQRGWLLWHPDDVRDLICSYGWGDPVIEEIALAEAEE